MDEILEGVNGVKRPGMLQGKVGAKEVSPARLKSVWEARLEAKLEDGVQLVAVELRMLVVVEVEEDIVEAVEDNVSLLQDLERLRGLSEDTLEVSNVRSGIE